MARYFSPSKLIAMGVSPSARCAYVGFVYIESIYSVLMRTFLGANEYPSNVLLERGKRRRRASDGILIPS